MKFYKLLPVVAIVLLLTGCDSSTSTQNTAGTSATALTGKQSTLVAAVLSDKLKIAAVSFDSSGKQQSASVAQLDKGSKRINFLNDKTFIYIGGMTTDDLKAQDHGTQIIKYDLSSSSSKVIYESKDGYVIDEIVLSPDKKYVAIWEVKLLDGVVAGGYSKVTQLSLVDNSQKVIAAEQKAEIVSKDTASIEEFKNLSNKYFVKYPLFYDKNNDLYCDTYGPDGGGWGNGLYVYRQASSTMEKFLEAGTYSMDAAGTTPAISKDGSLIAFTKPRSLFPASATGVRSANQAPEILSIYSVDTREEKIIQNKDDEQVTSPIFAQSGKKLAYVTYKSDAAGDLVIYNLESRATEKTFKAFYPTHLPLYFADDESYIIAGLFDNQKKVTKIGNYVVEADESSSSESTGLATAGKKYAPYLPAYTKFSTTTAKETELTEAKSYGEYIDVLPDSTMVTSSLASSANANAANNLKIGYVDFRDTLSSTRAKQQQQGSPKSKKDCDTIMPGFSTATTWQEIDAIMMKTDWYQGLSQKCKDAHDNIGTSRDKASGSVDIAFGQSTSRYTWAECFSTLARSDPYMWKCLGDDIGSPCVKLFNQGAGYESLASKCADSPLYLYPQTTQRVSVTTGAGAYNASPSAQNNSWTVTADPNGNLTTVDGKAFDKISYDYDATPAPLSTGIIATHSNLKEKLTWYAGQLGLNAKETSDFVAFWSNRLKDAPYIQISHYSRAESERLTKLTITPKPDTFIPIVMYFKKLDMPKILQQPIFEPIQQRVGFTALDWSGVVE